VRPCILIAEDHQDAREMLATLLRAHGYPVLQAKDGDQAIDLFDRHRPQLAILDMMMPKMGGYPVLEHFRDKSDAPPIIMITANEGSRHKAYAEYLGVVDYIRKPFAMERLLEAGRGSGVPKTAGTCRDILKRREALWTFVQVEGVEPTNNTAERSIRPAVLWRKGSFGTQSEEGSRFVESMLTVVATLKQQQHNVLEYLTAACEATLRGEAAPSLLPASDQQSQAAA